MIGAGALSALALFAFIDLLRIRADLTGGQDALRSFDLEQASTPGGIRATTGAARSRLDRAAATARHSWSLGLLAHLPGGGTQIRALRELTGAAARIGELADDAAEDVDVALAATKGHPEKRVTLLDVALEQIGRVDGALSTIDPGAHGRLVLPLADARDQLVRRLDKARFQLADARRQATALRAFLAGPSRALVLAANNAEMSGGAGSLLFGAPARVEAGNIDLAEMEPLGLYFMGQDYWVHTAGDVDRGYTKIGVGGDWRGASADPNFPLMAEVMYRMAPLTKLGPLDTIIVVDAITLQHLLAVTGPVSVAGTTYDAGNVLQTILNENYLRIDRQARYDLQGTIAKAIFEKIRSGDTPLTTLVSTLRTAAEGRHLLAWSRDPDLEAVWDAVGASGRIPPDGMLISMENFDGNKLDWYLQPHVDLKLVGSRDGRVHAEMTFIVTNPPRNPTSTQIEGGTDNAHFFWLDLHLPGGTTNLRSVDKAFQTGGNDPPSTFGVIIDSVHTGETKSWRFSFDLPAGLSKLQVLPSARVHPLTMRVNGFATDDAVARDLSLAGLPGSQAPRPHNRLLVGCVLGLLALAWSLVAYRTQQRRPSDPIGPMPFDVAVATWLLLAAAAVLLAGVAVHA